MIQLKRAEDWHDETELYDIWDTEKGTVMLACEGRIGVWLTRIECACALALGAVDSRDERLREIMTYVKLYSTCPDCRRPSYYVAVFSPPRLLPECLPIGEGLDALKAIANEVDRIGGKHKARSRR